MPLFLEHLHNASFDWVNSSYITFYNNGFRSSLWDSDRDNHFTQRLGS